MTAETILTDDTKEAVDDAIAAALGDAYDCNRVWSAWSYGTMGSDDFSLVAEDSGRLREITDAALQAVLQSPEVQKLKRDKEALLSALVYAEKVLCEQEDALRRFGVAEEDQGSELAILGAREALASIRR